jgi:hypothetical protein
MSKYFNIPSFALALAATICTGSVHAGPRACAPGLENVAGTCVTAGLAASVQLRGTLMSQLKIGYNLPIPPRKDTQFPRNFDVSRFEFSQPGNFSVETFPPSP